MIMQGTCKERCACPDCHAHLYAVKNGVTVVNGVRDRSVTTVHDYMSSQAMQLPVGFLQGIAPARLVWVPKRKSCDDSLLIAADGPAHVLYRHPFLSRITCKGCKTGLPGLAVVY